MNTWCLAAALLTVTLPSLSLAAQSRRDAERPSPQQSTTAAAARRPIPFPSAGRQWIRVEAPAFTAFSAAGEPVTLEIVRDLTALTERLVATSSLFARPPGTTGLFLFANERDSAAYFAAVDGIAVGTVGLTLRHPSGSSLLVETSARGGTSAIPRHETIHNLLNRNAALPLWAEEGLAEFYAVGGRPIREHILRVRSRLPMPVPALFAVQRNTPQAVSPWFYAESWAAVDALMARHPAGFFSMLEAIVAGTAPLEALQARFGMTEADLDWEMRRTRPPHAIAPPEGRDPLRAVPLARHELLFALGETLDRAPGQSEEADRHFAAALALAPDDPGLLLRYARHLLDVRGDADAALQCSIEAASRGAPAPRAAALSGAARMALGEDEAAIHDLEFARAAAPGDLETISRLYGVYMRLGERDTADALLPHLLDSPRSAEALGVLLETDLTRAQRLAAEGRLLAAREVLHGLAPRMPPRTRASIEAQISRLEAAASGVQASDGSRPLRPSRRE